MKQSAVRARIRQICCLGLPGELLMGSLLPTLREQGAALGQLSLYRSVEAPAFSPRERADLQSVMRYVAHGIAGGDGRFGACEPIAFEDSEEEAMIVIDRAGDIRHASERGRRLL